MTCPVFRPRRQNVASALTTMLSECLVGALGKYWHALPLVHINFWAMSDMSSRHSVWPSTTKSILSKADSNVIARFKKQKQNWHWGKNSVIKQEISIWLGVIFLFWLLEIHWSSSEVDANAIKDNFLCRLIICDSYSD